MILQFFVLLATLGLPEMAMDSSRGKMEYIKEHKIHLLFEQLADQLLSNRPSHPIPFLIEQLKALQTGTAAPTTTDSKATAFAGITESNTSKASTASPALTSAPQPAQAPADAVPAASPSGEKAPLKVTLAVFGLDAAGKSTLITAVAGEVDKHCAPTVGFSPNHFRSEAWDLMMFDLGGGSKFRGIWKEYYSELHGVVFVVDSANPSRLAEAKEALWGILQDSRATNKPLLIFANKQDVANAQRARDVEVALGVQDVPKHHVFGCSAIADPVDENIEKGLEWLLEEVTANFDDISLRIKKQLAEDKERRKIAIQEQQKRVAEYRKQWDAEEKEKEKEKDKHHS